MMLGKKETRSVLIVVNPKAGKHGYSRKLELIKNQLLENEHKFQVIFTDHSPTIPTKNLDLSVSQLTDVFVLGGDGTFNIAVNSLISHQIPFSILSNGTGNDSVKSLHGVVNFEKQLRIAIHGKVERFDIGLCNNRYFVNGVGIGFDGEVVKRLDEIGGQKGSLLSYLLTSLKIITKFQEQELKFCIDDQPIPSKGFAFHCLQWLDIWRWICDQSEGRYTGWKA